MNLMRRFVDLNGELATRILNKEKQALLLFTNDESDNDKLIYSQVLNASLWHSHEDYVIFAKVHPENQYFNEFAQPLGLDASSLSEAPKLFTFLKNATVKF
jgi:hypothetical protein